MQRLLCLAVALASSAAASSLPPPGYWPHYSGSREVGLLDGEWEYGYVGDALDSMDPSFAPSAAKTVAS